MAGARLRARYALENSVENRKYEKRFSQNIRALSARPPKFLLPSKSLNEIYAFCTVNKFYAQKLAFKLSNSDGAWHVAYMTGEVEVVHLSATSSSNSRIIKKKAKIFWRGNLSHVWSIPFKWNTIDMLFSNTYDLWAAFFKCQMSEFFCPYQIMQM